MIELTREAAAYQYLDANLRPIWFTSQPKTDDQAIDQFTWVRDISPAWHPKFIMAKRPGEVTFVLIKVEYNEETDEVYDL